MRYLLVLLFLFSCSQPPKDTHNSIGPDIVGNNHDIYKTKPIDRFKEFRAFIVSFDGIDDDEKLGLPEWVSYKILASSHLGRAPNRPRRWKQEEGFEGVSPKDDTYKNSGYSRGHMCMKHIAWRLGREADRETHSTLNACPQLQRFNAGIWLDLEYKTEKWADKYGQIWVICGPAFNNQQKEYIGDAGEMKIAIPHLFWKIIIKHDNGSVKTLAFLYPHKEISKEVINGKKQYNHRKYVVSIDNIETITGIDFLTELPDDLENKVEEKEELELWK